MSVTAELSEQCGGVEIPKKEGMISTARDKARGCSIEGCAENLIGVGGESSKMQRIVGIPQCYSAICPGKREMVTRWGKANGEY